MNTSLQSLFVLVAIVPSTTAFAALVLNDTGDYSNNFNHLATQGSLNAWTNDQVSKSASGSPGWYWQNDSTRFFYSGGSAQTPNPMSLGESGSAERAMGNYNGTGNLDTAWGVVFQNNTGQTISQIEVSYNGEQYRRAQSAADQLDFSFISSETEPTDFLPSSGATPLGWSSASSLSFLAPLTPGTPPFYDPSELAPPFSNIVPISDTLTVNVPHGHFLALRWYDGDVTGNDAALGIDDLTVKFTAVAVPEPSAFFYGTLICGLYGIGKHFRNRRAQDLPAGVSPQETA